MSQLLRTLFLNNNKCHQYDIVLNFPEILVMFLMKYLLFHCLCICSHAVLFSYGLIMRFLIAVAY